MDKIINKDNQINKGDIIKDDIQYYIELFCNEYDINIKSIRPQEWTAILSYIGNKYIKPSNILIVYMDKIPYKRYNFFRVNELLDKYIELCNIFNQSITIMGFSKISNINLDTIYTWKNNKEKYYLYENKDGSLCSELDLYNSSPSNRVRQLTIRPDDIYKKLLLNIEQNINDMVIDGKRRGIGPVVRYNKFYERQAAAGPGSGPGSVDALELARQLGIETKLQQIEQKK